jgi:putative CocE/NonD family hydrolase
MDRLAGRNLPFWQDWVQHAHYDDYWDAINDEKRWGEISVPAFNMGGWYDLYAQHTFINFNGLRLHGGAPAARQSKLVVGPWPHALSTSSRTGDVDFGAHSMLDLEALELRWFDYWLKGMANGIVDEPPLRLFIMGINQWRDEHEWPLARTQWQQWYLHSNGNANTLRGDGSLGWQQLLLAPYCALGAIRSARGRDAQRRAMLYQRAAGRGYGSDRPDQSRPLCRHRRSRHRLDSQAGGCLAYRLCHEPVRWHYPRSLS